MAAFRHTSVVQGQPRRRLVVPRLPARTTRGCLLSPVSLLSSPIFVSDFICFFCCASFPLFLSVLLFSSHHQQHMPGDCPPASQSLFTRTFLLLASFPFERIQSSCAIVLHSRPNRWRSCGLRRGFQRIGRERRMCESLCVCLEGYKKFGRSTLGPHFHPRSFLSAAFSGGQR